MSNTPLIDRHIAATVCLSYIFRTLKDVQNGMHQSRVKGRPLALTRKVRLGTLRKTFTRKTTTKRMNINKTIETRSTHRNFFCLILRYKNSMFERATSTEAQCSHTQGTEAFASATLSSIRV